MSLEMVQQDCNRKVENERKEEEERWLVRHITSGAPKIERATTTYDPSYLSGRCNRRYKVVPTGPRILMKERKLA
ncbi:hypothetical protein SESBI_01562 [Sesbania bispinosa]|nr:hypothetical protein SESBI_01562 [Sesbania bispinosa]